MHTVNAARMPGSLNYSPSGSEGGRSFVGGGVDLERSLIGEDLTTTPGKREEISLQTNQNKVSMQHIIDAYEAEYTPYIAKGPHEHYVYCPKQTSW